MDLKKEAARAAVQFVQHNHRIGLGAGSTMAHMADLLQQKAAEGLAFRVYTSSFSTARLLQQKGFAVQQATHTSAIDLYFDGCDQFDAGLNALKSGGGVHTSEKILAFMAGEFILVGDESKYVQELSTRFPLVVEVLPEALTYVQAQIGRLFAGTTSSLRQAPQKDGAIVTDHGNYLLDVMFTAWPPLEQINPAAKSIPGVVETSLFFGIAQKAVIAGEQGVQVLYKQQ
ncbi:ribose 5-phosphate isomerase A [Deminuibacter soli]|uniref:Ribose 5-phosphate isomerase A n=1 Tax=Deminuibacter soli TaxID=2291815 RepID=A0A3E1NFB4_9BACT|nr:ribose 5-phosphate isomerase A [Deminuibacter soli]RFM26478.1 ribose 5-phosphate isomerase A [Deminuibacter soli]